jgi:hypothetical protein
MHLLVGHWQGSRPETRIHDSEWFGPTTPFFWLLL